MVAHVMHISAHIAHTLLLIGDMRIMQFAHIWQISMQSMNVVIIFMSILPLLIHCIMASMHMAMQLRQSSIHRRISIDISISISIFCSPRLGWCNAICCESPETELLQGA
jgi:hypothetical protein